MKPSTMTLSGAVNLLPRILRDRYSGDGTFALKMASFILGQFEKQLENEWMFLEVGLPLADDTTDYALDSRIRQIRGIYSIIDAGDLVPRKSDPISFQELGPFIRFPAETTLSANADISGTAVAGSSISTIKATAAGILDTAIADDALVSRMVRLTATASNSGKVEDKIIVANDTALKNLTINGAFATAVSAGDTFLVTDNFFLIEALRYLNKPTLLANVLDIPIDWEECFISTLHWLYEMQSEEGSVNTRYWAEKARSDMRNLKADGRKRGDNPKPQGRRLPPFFK